MPRHALHQIKNPKSITPKIATALVALATAVGEADPAYLEALLTATTEEALRAVGRRIDSQRVLDDTLRTYQTAWRGVPKIWRDAMEPCC